VTGYNTLYEFGTGKDDPARRTPAHRDAQAKPAA
jgi:hypothetical protein